MGGKANSRCRVGNWFSNFFSFLFELGIILEGWAGVLFELWRLAGPQGGRMKYGDTLAGSVLRWQDWWEGDETRVQTEILAFRHRILTCGYYEYIPGIGSCHRGLVGIGLPPQRRQTSTLCRL
jgi:hypothetical protein